MRLTLRTLLAWLDDTLPPVEVRQIGHQVAESPFAQELVERIHRVTRQRRLTVPNNSGPEATDPNLVAGYLDNELNADLVADYEKKCLTSDVHLAEVASAHQILSLIGQKAKVPADARYRMYRLVKGREALSGKSPRAYSPPDAEPLTEPLVPWTPPEPPPRSWIERFGPPAFVVLLIAVLLWASWIHLSPSGSQPAPSGLATATPVAGGQNAAPAPPLGQPKNANLAGAGGPAAAALLPEATREAAVVPAAGEAGPESKPPAAGSDAAAKTAKPASELPAGALGVIEKAEGILIRQGPDPNAHLWERLKAKAPIQENDRLVNLEHYRNEIKLGAVRVALVGDAEMRPHPADRGQAAQFDFVRGRVVVYGINPPAPVGFNVVGHVLTITPPASAPVGLEIASDGSSGPSLRIFAQAGDVALASGAAKESLTGPGVVVFDASGKFTGKEKKDAPAWVIDESLSPLDKQIGDQLAHYFKSDRGIKGNLLEAMDDPQKDVREVAISTLGAIGDIDLVVSALSTPGAKVSRQAAIHTLRSLIARGTDSAKAVQAEIEQAMGKDQVETVRKLLDGYTAKEAREEGTYKTLVQLLASPDPGVRELALDNLESLTGRNDNGFDADSPEGEGLKRWQELLKRKELRPIGTPPPAPTPR